ncbi:MAG: 16S rRNA (cytosine(1402)-N(4))-methyltransferase RsmH [Candidatus Babeliaceae bacterium]
MSYHKSVLTREVLEYLALHPDGIYVDATFGGGGHTRAILQAEPRCSVIALDWDKLALEMNGPVLEQEFPGRIQFLWGNFSQIKQHLKKKGIKQVDGILADFGTSQYQIAQKEGISFARDTQLDMRLSPAHYTITAADIVNTASESELMYIFKEFGQERFSKRIAHAIVEARKKKRFKTTGQLVDVILSVVAYNPRFIHPATRVFQALRIVVNKELDNIHSFLLQTLDCLKPGGRLVCISFHSLEDGLVKRFLKEHSDQMHILTTRVVIATAQETSENPSARSAKLRAAEKLPEKV